MVLLELFVNHPAIVLEIPLASYEENHPFPWAVVAVGHSLLVVTYKMLKHGQSYSELGADYRGNTDCPPLFPRKTPSSQLPSK